MATVFKRTVKGGDGHEVKAKKYTIEYTDEFGLRRTRTGFKDKQASLELARRLETEAERIRAGLPVIKQEAQDAKILDVLTNYLQWCKTRNQAAATIRENKRVLERICRIVPFVKISDVTTERFDQYLNELANAGKASGTRNHYRDVLNRFMIWATKNRYTNSNPITGVEAATRTLKYKKRPFTTDEMRKLFAAMEACQKERSKNALSVFKVALYSGLRYQEIERLEVRDIDLSNPSKPLLRLRAEAQKGKRDEVIPMLKELQEALAPLLANKDSHERIFKKVPTNGVLGSWLSRAGIKRINDQGRRLSWHSFRLTFCYILAQKLPIQTVRILMRHKDIRMTCNVYLDLGLNEVSQEVWDLPPLFNNKEKK